MLLPIGCIGLMSTALLSNNRPNAHPSYDKVSRCQHLHLMGVYKIKAFVYRLTIYAILVRHRSNLH